MKAPTTENLADQFRQLEPLTLKTGRKVKTWPAVNLAGLVASGRIPNPLIREVVRTVMEKEDRARDLLFNPDKVMTKDDLIDVEVDTYRDMSVIVSCYVAEPRIILEGDPGDGEIAVWQLDPYEIWQLYHLALGGVSALKTFRAESQASAGAGSRRKAVRESTKRSA